MWVLTPFYKNINGLGSYPFARHYLGNRLFTFFSSGYLDGSVPQVPLTYAMYSRMDTKELPLVRSRIHTGFLVSCATLEHHGRH